jgi:penicillin-insensitive murein endopeptidase
VRAAAISVRSVRSVAAFAALVATVTLSTVALPGSVGGSHVRGLVRHTGGLNAKVAAASGLGPAALRFGRSVGSPTQGHLIGGERLTESEALRIVPSDTAGDVRWGLEPLVAMIERGSRAVRKQFPDAVLSVGHLSREGGGDVDQHRSHESGRDADVGFYVRSYSGRPLMPSHLVAFRGDGTARSWPGAYFDDARNWTLVASLCNDPQARVTHIFVAAPLRARLLAQAERVGAPARTRMRAAELMQQPHGTLPHDDHFHVRIACPAHMTSCIENPAPRVIAHARVHAPVRRSSNGSSPAGAPGPRDGEPSPRALVTAAPQRTPAPAPTPELAPAHEPALPGKAEAPADDAPPASMVVPVDDVDG